MMKFQPKPFGSAVVMAIVTYASIPSFMLYSYLTFGASKESQALAPYWPVIFHYMTFGGTAPEIEQSYLWPLMPSILVIGMPILLMDVIMIGLLLLRIRKWNIKVIKYLTKSCAFFMNHGGVYPFYGATSISLGVVCAIGAYSPRDPFGFTKGVIDGYMMVLLTEVLWRQEYVLGNIICCIISICICVGALLVEIRDAPLTVEDMAGAGARAFFRITEKVQKKLLKYLIKVLISILNKAPQYYFYTATGLVVIAVYLVGKSEHRIRRGFIKSAVDGFGIVLLTEISWRGKCSIPNILCSVIGLVICLGVLWVQSPQRADRNAESQPHARDIELTSRNGGYGAVVVRGVQQPEV